MKPRSPLNKFDKVGSRATGKSIRSEASAFCREYSRLSTEEKACQLIKDAPLQPKGLSPRRILSRPAFKSEASSFVAITSTCVGTALRSVTFGYVRNPSVVHFGHTSTPVLQSQGRLSTRKRPPPVKLAAPLPREPRVSEHPNGGKSIRSEASSFERDIHGSVRAGNVVKLRRNGCSDGWFAGTSSPLLDGQRGLAISRASQDSQSLQAA
jgi:hypothetical protein